jgi:serine/threonine protein phosphatase PrpC
MISAKPDIIKKPLAAADYIIMGCDGIWETKSNQEMVDYLNRKLSEDKEPKKKRTLKEIT